MLSIEKPLLSWYRRHRRPLPWRETPGPYRVWVSELMLQQTRVGVVLPYFERFVERFPDVFALAAAREQEVLAAWSGLGYYRRAKALHRAARTIVRERRGAFPDTLEGWTALPGVGRYTAGAILSIAFGKRVPILDGNVARVLARLFEIRGDPRRQPARGELWQRAEEILPRRAVSDFNQALMELGALVCLPRRPRCLVCPLAATCLARRHGVEELLPESAPRKQTVPVSLAAAVVRRSGRVLLYRRSRGALMRDLWELPGGACLSAEPPREALVREALARYGIELEAGEEIARVKHHIMNEAVTLHAFHARLRSELTGRSKDRVWAHPERDLPKYPMSSMTRKVFAAFEAAPSETESRRHHPR